METVAGFDISGEYSEQDLVDELSDHYAVIKERTDTETLTLLDTFDWRLFNASLLLRQSGDELILRQLTTNIILQRQPLDKPVKFVWDLPDGELKRQLEPIVEMRALLAFSAGNLCSTVYRILNKAEKTVARLIYESFEANEPADDSASAKHIYLKPVKGYPKQARKVKYYLETAGLEPGQNSLLAKAMVSGLRRPGDYSAKLDLRLEPHLRADEATKSILRRLLQVMKSNEAGLEQDIDTEFLHDFRVAVRRTRSALSQIKGVFPEEITLRFKRDFAYIGKLTNDLRDLDVYLLAEESYKMMLPETLRGDIEPLFDYLRQKRSAALIKATDGLASKEYAEILQDWAAFLDEPPPESPTTAKGGGPIIDLARRRIYKKYRQIIKWGNQILENTEDEQLHALRIECKKLRYLIEFFASLFPRKEIKALLKQLKKLQINLGDFNDLCVQEDYLLNIAQEIPLTGSESRRVLLAIGCLVDTLHQERLRVKADFAQTFADFARPANKQRFEKLFAGRKQGKALS